MRGLTKCERKFKRLLVKCPGIVDTTDHEQTSGDSLIHDTVYVDRIIDRTEELLDSILKSRPMDTTMIVKGDSVFIYIPIPCELTKKEKKLIKDQVRNEVLKTMEPPKLIEDTLRIPFEMGTVNVWQDKGKIWHQIKYKKAEFTDPCPDQMAYWWQWLIIGFIAGFLICLWLFGARR